MYLSFLRYIDKSVAFAYHDQHFNIDHEKSEKLPNFTCSHHSCEFTRDHCQVELINLKVYFFFFHTYLLLIISLHFGENIVSYSGIKVQPGLSFAL